MKVIIAGSRTITDFNLVEAAIVKSGWFGLITEIVSGCAKGVDTLGENWAVKYNRPIKKFPADWNRHGKAAGPIRNNEMAQYADGLVAIWDGESAGTKHMIERARYFRKKVYIYETKPQNGFDV